ncbi:MAG: succinate dehydrogenase, cytochrome b556 subunit [Hyphomicrobiaceae bacterium]
MTGPHNAAYRWDTLWIFAQVHRVSGVLLAIFLPLHFLALGLAIDGEARFEGFIAWTQNPIVKLAETALLFTLAVHLLGGLRVLIVENLSWRPQQKQMALGVAAVAAVVAIVFLIGT